MTNLEIDEDIRAATDLVRSEADANQAALIDFWADAPGGPVEPLFGLLYGDGYETEPTRLDDSGNLIAATNVGCLTQVRGMSDDDLDFGVCFPQSMPAEARKQFLRELLADTRIPVSENDLAFWQLEAFEEWQQRHRNLAKEWP